MKYLLLGLLAFQTTAFAEQEYRTNDGKIPGTLEEKSNVQKYPATGKKALDKSDTAQVMEKEEEAIDGTGAPSLSTEDMNTAPNPAPTTRGEVINDATLTKPMEQQDREEWPDYKTSPEKRTTKPLGPNKK